MRQPAAVSSVSLNVVTPFIVLFVDYRWRAVAESLRIASRSFVINWLNQSSLL